MNANLRVVYAKESRWIPFAWGGGRKVNGGEHWWADDPLVLEHPDLFAADPGYGLQSTVEPPGYDDPPVEQATASPGEKRQSVRRG